MERNLVISVTCNPPSISIVGPVKENTIDTLNAVLPRSCTTTNTENVPFAFVWKEEPPHWYGELQTHFASDDIGQSQIFVSMIDALEEEGCGWTLCGSNTANTVNDKRTMKLFFVRA